RFEPWCAHQASQAPGATHGISFRQADSRRCGAWRTASLVAIDAAKRSWLPVKLRTACIVASFQRDRQGWPSVATAGSLIDVYAMHAPGAKQTPPKPKPVSTRPSSRPAQSLGIDKASDQ